MSTWSFIFGCLASYITVKFAPGASGSGIAEIMGYLNGVNYPKLIGLETLIVKILGVAIAISAQAAIGKEGPLVHIGTLVGMLVAYYIPFEFLKKFRNDKDKREFAVYGIAAGVSAAFSAPIGGTLFAYELSRPSTFWSFGMIWRTFFASAVSTYTISLYDHIWRTYISKSKEHQNESFYLSTEGSEKFG
jgi:H+/Cl- antiporter ClcA